MVGKDKTKCGVLGRGKEVDAVQNLMDPIFIPNKDHVVLSIASGCYHALAIAKKVSVKLYDQNNMDVFGWGSNVKGKKQFSSNL